MVNDGASFVSAFSHPLPALLRGSPTGTPVGMPRLPVPELQDAVFQSPFPDRDAERHADQIRVLELGARPLVAVVQQDLHAPSSRRP